MSEEVIGRGIIEISGDSSKLNAAIAEARRNIGKLGDGSEKSAKKASASIDAYIKKINLQNSLHGKSAREVELYKLALKGATNEQLRAANSALRLADAHKRMDRLKAVAPAVGLALAAGFVAAAVAMDRLIKRTADFQDIAEKVGDSAENVASLSVSMQVGGTSAEQMTSAMNKLEKNLTGVDDESKEAGAALKALGLNIKDFKQLGATDRIETLAKALDNFADGPQKSAVAMALMGRSGAELLPTLKEIAKEGGRRVILTQQEIEAADEYADRQKRLTSELGAYAEKIAIEALPLMSAFTEALVDIAKDEEFAATASAILKGSIGLLVDTFQVVAKAGSRLGLFLNITGMAIGALIAQLGALKRLDLKGFSAISDAFREDMNKALAEHDRFIQKIESIDQPKPEAPQPTQQNIKAFGGINASVSNYLKKNGKPAVNYNGKVSGSSGSEKETKAQKESREKLKRDLDEIKDAGQKTANAYANAEKILEARRAANLVNDEEYHEAKLGFLRLNAQAQESSLKEEIKRLEQEKAVGKDKLANEQKITEARAQLVKVQEDLAVNTEVLTIQAAAAAERLAKAYLDAAANAKIYLDEIKRRNDREVAGVGRGRKFREREGQRNEIEDRFIEQRQGLDRDLRNGEIDESKYTAYLDVARKTYAEEIRLLEERNARLDELMRNGAAGIKEALQNYVDEAQNFSGMLEETVGGALSGLEDSLVQFATTGEATFKQLGQAIMADFARMGFRMLIGQASQALLSFAGGGGGGAAGAAASAAGAVAEGASDATKAASAAALAAAEGAAATAIVAASTTSAAALAALAASASAAAAAMAAAAASSGASAGTGIAGTIAAVAGGREIGGPVSANKMYRINEKKIPEILNVAGQQFLLMGSQPGYVDPVNGGSAARAAGNTIINNINVHATPQTSRATALQTGGEVARAINASRRNG